MRCSGHNVDIDSRLKDQNVSFKEMKETINEANLLITVNTERPDVRNNIILTI